MHYWQLWNKNWIHWTLRADWPDSLYKIAGDICLRILSAINAVENATTYELWIDDLHSSGFSNVKWVVDVWRTAIDKLRAFCTGSNQSEVCPLVRCKILFSCTRWWQSQFPATQVRTQKGKPFGFTVQFKCWMAWRSKLWRKIRIFYRGWAEMHGS